MPTGISQELIDRLEGDPSVTRVYGTTAAAADPRAIAMAEQYLENPRRLAGDPMPNAVRMTEKPQHRMMVYLHACGQDARQIANQLNLDYGSVCQILRQPWARNLLVTMLDELGRDQVKHFLQTQVNPSLQVLQEIRDNSTAKHSDRIAATNSILNRALGMPVAHVESKNTNRNIPVDLARLDAEIESVRTQLASKGSEVHANN